MSKRTRVLWTTPVFQSVYAAPFGNFMAMALSAGSLLGDRYEISPHIPARQLLHEAMNTAVDVVLKHDFDVLLVSDDDCFPPYDAIARLLAHYEDGKEVVSGVGYMRGFPHTTTAGRYYPEGPTLTFDPITNQARVSGFYWVDDIAGEPDTLVPVDFCGLPVAMIAKTALKRIEAPWFGTSIDGGSCTHDVYFGAKAKRAGVDLFVDKSIDCGHLMDAQIITSQNRALTRGVAQAWHDAQKAPA